ncbi:energy transducer TonB [Phaeocystidibacter luteus]|uniref:Energy transducer TonB n=1 Tax=Phaeocystidibacter luteus TaxID=911197 RepID=A0A6N6RGM4_9FLAO|nr:energy transducer TonB [Phaeocystidibacter luteus]KAB2810253.1 energy transducer TonB [Phaeocystidibacter luteus]
MSDQKDKRNGRIAAILFAILTMVWLIFFGFTYLDPPPEEGIAINFGYDAAGSGSTSSAQQSEQPTQPEEAQPQPQTQTAETDVATQSSVDAPSINTQETQQQQVEEQEPDPQPSNRLNSALQSTRDGTGAGEGVTEGGGDQGDPNGDPNSQSRTGNGGSGNSGKYDLGGRRALQTPEPDKGCSGEGTVVVKVYVNRSGTVTRAIPGEESRDGTIQTNTFDPCLFDKARSAAMRTKWQGDANAPDEQVGFIIYNFIKN